MGGGANARMGAGEAESSLPVETLEEMRERKQRVCSKCAYYLGGEHGLMGTCNYLLITEHKRPCLPTECVEKGVFKAIKGKRVHRRGIW